MKRPNAKSGKIAVLLGLAIMLSVFGWNPFAPYRDTSTLYEVGYRVLETGSERQGNGIYLVKALTRMPDVKAKMVRWWFADYMQTTEHYKRWHPTAHVWMDWENKVPGELVGASHLVHEYIGNELQKLRIQFVDPSEFIEGYEPRDDHFTVCARVGLLEDAINMTSMCHIVRDTAFGAEMRSTFWLGHVSKREGNEQVSSIEGALGNTALVRFLLINSQLATDLMTHAIEEMGNLGDFLPELYAKETQSDDAPQLQEQDK